MAYLEVELADLVAVLAANDPDEVATAIVDQFDTVDLIISVLEQYGEEKQSELIIEIVEKLYLPLYSILSAIDDDEELISDIVELTEKRSIRPDLLVALQDLTEE